MVTKYKILTENGNKTFTYITEEYFSDGSFVSFVDKEGKKRFIPISRIVEVIQFEE